MPDYPYTPRRGQFKGRTFDTPEAFAQAVAEAKSDAGGGEDSTPAPRVKAPSSRSANKVSREMADGLVQVANLVLSIVPATRGDVLDPTESKALALAILDTARTNKAFANIIVKVCSVQSNARLASTVGCLVAVRLARHEANLPIVGTVPPEIGLTATMMLYALASEEVPADVPVPTPAPPHTNGVGTTPTNLNGTVAVGSPDAAVLGL